MHSICEYQASVALVSGTSSICLIKVCFQLWSKNQGFCLCFSSPFELRSLDNMHFTFLCFLINTQFGKYFTAIFCQSLTPLPFARKKHIVRWYVSRNKSYRVTYGFWIRFVFLKLLFFRNISYILAVQKFKFITSRTQLLKLMANWHHPRAQGLIETVSNNSLLINSMFFHW